MSETESECMAGMEVYINVKNFGKISEARVNISNFTVFVGNNNSGKTKLMELIYTVVRRLSSMSPDVELPQIEDMDAFYIGKKELYEINEWVNAYLAEHIHEMIEEAFNVSVPMEEITLEFERIESNYEIYFFTDKTLHYILDQNHRCSEFLSREALTEMISDQERFYGSLILEQNGQGIKESMAGARYSKNIPIEFARNIAIRNVLGEILGAKRLTSSNMLFLPASRMGLMLLYKRFFSNRNQDEEVVKRRELKTVTEPVLDFLTFLLEYNYTEQTAKKNEELIQFISANLIDGTITEQGDATIYTPEGQTNGIPVFVASSMVNEVVPVMKALTDSSDVDFLFYDEVETSMHPLKQMEMVKLLNRLNNKGIRLIVSTHSDTMATKINNLLLLSRGEYDFKTVQDILGSHQIQVEKEDLLISSNIHVYQFVNVSKDKSIVEELQFQNMPCTGYDFSQFHDSTMHLFEEAKIAMGITDED